MPPPYDIACLIERNLDVVSAIGITLKSRPILGYENAIDGAINSRLMRAWALLLVTARKLTHINVKIDSILFPIFNVALPSLHDCNNIRWFVSR